MASKALPTDHSGMAVLSVSDCLDRLRRAGVGRLAVIHNGEPVILPVNHEMDGETVVFRTAEGAKLVSAMENSPVSFEVDDFDADRRSGWSVVIRGVADVIDDPTQIDRWGALGVRPWADAVQRSHWVRIRPYEITGRQIIHPAIPTR